MKLKFCGPQHVPAIDPDGEHEVVESQLLHRFTLVDGVAVDKYPGKTDREIMAIEHAEAVVAITAAQAAWMKMSLRINFQDQQICQNCIFQRRNKNANNKRTSTGNPRSLDIHIPSSTS
jgi:hypothetical protein